MLHEMLLRGEERGATSHKYCLTAASLTRWRQAILERGEAGVNPGQNARAGERHRAHIVSFPLLIAVFYG